MTPHDPHGCYHRVRVQRAADDRPSVPLAANAERNINCARARGRGRLRVFGSAMGGDDCFDSDVDLLVTPSETADLLDLALFCHEVEELTGFPTEVVCDTSVPAALAEAVREAMSL